MFKKICERVFGNLKTSIAGVSVAIATFVALFGYEIDPKLVSYGLSGFVALFGLIVRN